MDLSFGKAREHHRPSASPRPGQRAGGSFLGADERRAHEQARDDIMNKIIEIAPDSPQGYNLLGTHLANRNKLDEARQIFERGLANIPNDPILLHNRGRLELSQGNEAGAMKSFQAAAEQSGKVSLGLLYLQISRSNPDIAERMTQPMLDWPLEEALLMQATFSALQEQRKIADFWLKEASQLGDLSGSPWIEVMTQRGLARKTAEGYASASQTNFNKQ